MIDIGKRRQLFWDDYLIETSTATLKQHKAVTKNISMDTDDAWGGSYCGYPVVFEDGDIIRLYYLSSNAFFSTENPTSYISSKHICICYAESHDGGITFIKPSLGLFEYDGNKNNNIIMQLGGKVKSIDNFAVFKDDNPICKADEKYKAIASNKDDDPNNWDSLLCYYKSSDGINFTYGGELLNEGKFDSLNCCFWDKNTNLYYLYMRDWFDGKDSEISKKLKRNLRGIRYTTSKDFKNWDKSKALDFGNAEVVELYTNAIKPYYRANDVFLGMPSRYIERTEWEPNFDSLSNPEHRKLRSLGNMRFGTVITDCVLITSRDGKKYNRQNEAFLTPGIENGLNWVYGDCYPSYGLIETKSEIVGEPNELSFYTLERHFQGPQLLRRNTIRIDGFLSYNSGYKESEIITKPLTFEGNKLSLNFATSAIGYIKISIMDIDYNIIEGYEGYPVFGDSLDKSIIFKDGINLSELNGKAIRLQITMRDADIYSLIFI